MKQDIKEISYSLSQAERIKAKKEQEKKLLNDLKQDIKYVLLGLIETYYQEKEDFFDILENEGIIREKAEQQIKDLKIKYKDIEHDKRNMPTYVEKEKIKYENIDDLYLSELIENEFLVQYKRFKQKQLEYKKLADAKATEIIFNDLCEYYEHLKRQLYLKKDIMYVLNKNRDDIINDLQNDYKYLLFTDKQYNKALRDIKNKYADDIQQKQKPSKQQKVAINVKRKVPLSIKLYLGLKLLNKYVKRL